MNITSNNSKSKVVPKARTPQNGQTKEVYEAVKPPPAQTDQVGFRVRLESFLSGRVGTTIELVSLAVSILTVIAHITNTYIGGWIFRRFLYIDVAIMFFYFLEFLLQLYISQHKLLFFFSIYSFISISSFLPLTFVFYNLNELIYRITLVLRSIRIVRYLLKFFSTIKNEVSRQIYTIFLTVFSLILVTAGIIQVFEDDNQESIRNSDM
jgi:hypothetical protein